MFRLKTSFIRFLVVVRRFGGCARQRAECGAGRAALGRAVGQMDRGQSVAPTVGGLAKWQGGAN